MTTPEGASWFARHALLPSGPARDVRFEITDGRFTSVTADAGANGARLLPGVVLPGFANGHSHAFHRALRGRTHSGGGTFWTWRQQMYGLAGRLDPDGYLALALCLLGLFFSHGALLLRFAGSQHSLLEPYDGLHLGLLVFAEGGLHFL